MLNPSAKRESRIVLIATLLVAVLSLTLPIFRGDVLLVDPFHYGEFLAAAAGLSSGASLPFHPLTIHGALDYIPALFAAHHWGSDHYFLPTVAIYKVLDFLAATFLILIAYGLTKRTPHQWLILLSVALVAPLLVGFRDLVLLVSVYLFLQVEGCDVRRVSSMFLQVLLGATVAFGVFWSYDRGLAGSLSLGAAVLVLLQKNRWYAISLVSFVAVISGLSLSFKVLSIESYLSNISVLMQISGDWSYGWQGWPVALTAFALVLNITAVVSIVIASLKSKSVAERLPTIVCFCFLSLFLLRVGVNRADLTHVYFSCWVPMLIFLFLYGKERSLFTQIRVVIFAIFVVAMALTIFLESYGLALLTATMVFTVLRFRSESINRLTRTVFGVLVFSSFGLITYVAAMDFSDGQYAWIKSLSSPGSNRLSSTDGVVWASDRLQEQEVECVFDLSNNGVINGLIGRPSCSRFTYPVYAGALHESILISDLRSAAPPAIVYSSTYWSYSIDGRSMKMRFPGLDAFILKNYPKQQCGHGYCIRYMGT